MSETERNEPLAERIAREQIARWASMPEDRPLRWAHGVIETLRALGHNCHEYSFAAVAIIAAHEREAAKDATIAELRKALAEACKAARGYFDPVTTDEVLTEACKLAEGGK